MHIKYFLLFLLALQGYRSTGQDCLLALQQIRQTPQLEKKALLLNRYFQSGCTDSIANISLHVVGLAYRSQVDNPFGLMLLDRAIAAVTDDHRLYMLRGDLLVLKEQFKLAEADYRKAVQLAPPADQTSLIKCHIAIAGVLIDQAGKGLAEGAEMAYYSEAFQHTDRVLALDSSHLQALDLKSVALYNSRQYAASIPVFERRVQLLPLDQELLRTLARACREAGKYAGETQNDLPTAQYFLYKSYTHNPNDPETLRLLGTANGIAGQHQQALEWFKKASVLEPQNARIWLDISISYGLSGKKRLMKKYQKKAYRLDPTLQKKG